MTTPPILPINPSVTTDQNALTKSTYKTIYQLCNASQGVPSGDLGPSGANTRAFSTTYTAEQRIFVAVTGFDASGTGNGATITPLLNGVLFGPSNSAGTPGPAGTGFMVPAGATYSVLFVASGGTPTLTLQSWFETPF